MKCRIILGAISALFLFACEGVETETVGDGGTGGAGGQSSATTDTAATMTETPSCQCPPAADCHTSLCANGHCAEVPRENNTACDDDLGVCEDGACNPCRHRHCFVAGCSIVPVADGTACGNDKICTAGECH